MNWNHFIEKRAANLIAQYQTQPEYLLIQEKKSQLQTLIADLLPPTSVQPALECIEACIDLEKQENTYLLQMAYRDCIAMLKEGNIL